MSDEQQQNQQNEIPRPDIIPPITPTQAALMMGIVQTGMGTTIAEHRHPGVHLTDEEPTETSDENTTQIVTEKKSKSKRDHEPQQEERDHQIPTAPQMPEQLITPTEAALIMGMMQTADRRVISEHQHPGVHAVGEEPAATDPEEETSEAQ